jgi:hypothetical protein
MDKTYPADELLVDQPDTFVLNARLPAPLERRVTDLEAQAKRAGMPVARYVLIGAILLRIKVDDEELRDALISYNQARVAQIGELDESGVLRVIHGSRGRPRTQLATDSPRTP